MLPLYVYYKIDMIQNLLVFSSDADIFLYARTNAKGLPNIKKSDTSKSNLICPDGSLVDEDLLRGEGAIK